MSEALEKVFKEEAGLVLACLIARSKNFDLAEEAFPDATLIVLERWTREGPHENSAAWLSPTARRRAIDRLQPGGVFPFLWQNHRVRNTDPTQTVHPPEGSRGELARFEKLQSLFPEQFRQVFSSTERERAVVVVPSLSLDQHVLDKVAGAPHYEERLLCLLMLLRMPRTRIVFVTSNPIHPTIIDYYLHLLPGIPVSHARKRLVLLSCYDDSSRPLTRKLLDRPRLLERIREHVPDPNRAHITCFNSTPLERTLAVRLGLPLYACDPGLVHLGNKSHGREIIKEAGVRVAEGMEHLRDDNDILEALCELKGRFPEMRRAVVKLNEGFSGEGNAVFPFEGCPTGSSAKSWVREELPTRLQFEAEGESWEMYRSKFCEMGGIAERFIEGDVKHSPTARIRIDPLGNVEAISTQDQVLGGPSGQVYLACRFPSAPGYRRDIQDQAISICEVLRDRGVLGQVGVDFLCVKREDGWDNYAIENNVRMGGATHPFWMLKFLTDGHYDADSATYRTRFGEPRCYYASDNVQSDAYRGLTADDLVDIAVENGLHFDGATQKGVVFHLIGALSRFGKLGMVCIDDDLQAAEQAYFDTLEILKREGAR